MFRKHHYLSSGLNHSAKCHVALWDDKPVAFCATLHVPHARCKNLKRCSRIVTLPDYQGVGIGLQMLNTVAPHFRDGGFRYLIRTSQKQMIPALHKQRMWCCKQYGRSRNISASSKLQSFRRTSSCNRVTALFEYVSQVAKRGSSK